MSTPARPPSSLSSATLWVVATPIGHLGDLSPRAREVLHSVALIAAEDTRISQRLLADRSSPPRWVVLNEHSEHKAIATVLAALQAGESVALISDAGTPLVSDPGYRLVSAAHAAGLTVSPVPGPCAAVAALSVAGLPSDRFHFEGFLPARAAARRQRLLALAEVPSSLIFYVPARDLATVLEDVAAQLGGQRQATVARELTKRHETVRRDSVTALQHWCQQDPNQQRGEAVLVVAGCDQAATAVALPALVRELAAALPPSQAAGMLARLSGWTRREAFAVISAARGEASEAGTD